MRIFLIGFIPEFLETPVKGEKYFESFIQDKIMNNKYPRFLKFKDTNGNNIQKMKDGKIDTDYYIKAITALKESAEKALREF